MKGSPFLSFFFFIFITRRDYIRAFFSFFFPYRVITKSVAPKRYASKVLRLLFIHDLLDILQGNFVSTSNEFFFLLLLQYIFWKLKRATEKDSSAVEGS